MTPEIAVYGFETSNNMKVRIALGYKEIPYEFHTIDPRDRPGLFGATHREQWEIEDEELLARASLSGPLMEIVHQQVYGDTVDDAMQARCAEKFGEATARLADRLGSGQWLVGDGMTAADITAAAVIHRVRVAGMFEIRALDRLAPWVDRVMSYDRGG
ncbi:MAG: glutathione S-transferase family protein [bacterium]|nr:glutathione S-transferase family protein [bacterium]